MVLRPTEDQRIASSTSSSVTEIAYIGNELALFADAHNWKRYLADTLRPYLRGGVAEVGAGIGTTTAALIANPAITEWTCIEPDLDQARSLEAMLIENGGRVARVVAGTLGDLAADAMFDTIIYIDVVEHIEDDRSELALAAAHLNPGGNLVVLVPAWEFLYSPFDRAIGHFRRYNKASLRAVAPAGLREVAAFYRDSVGFFASVANKLALRQGMPTVAQIALWDSYLVPLSRIADPLLASLFGKSVILVWQRPR